MIITSEKLFNGILAPFHRQYRNIASGKCYILGGGASVREMNIAHFTDAPFITVNWSIFHTDISRLTNPYHVIAEPGYFNVAFRRLPKEERKKRHLYVRKLSQIQNETAIFAHCSNWTSLRIQGVKSTPIYRTYARTDWIPAHGFHATSCAFSASLLLARYLGFSEVIMLGFDSMLFKKATDMRWQNTSADVARMPKEFQSRATHRDMIYNPSVMSFINQMSSSMRISAIAIDEQSFYVDVLDYRKDLNLETRLRMPEELLTPEVAALFSSKPAY